MGRPGHQHQLRHRDAVGHQGRDEGAEGLPDDDEVLGVADRVENGVGVVRQAGFVVGREVGGDGAMALGSQLGLD